MKFCSRAVIFVVLAVLKLELRPHQFKKKHGNFYALTWFILQIWSNIYIYIAQFVISYKHCVEKIAIC